MSEHYRRGPHEAKDIIRFIVDPKLNTVFTNSGLVNLGQVLKYLCRAGHKPAPGKTIQEATVVDLRKAMAFLGFLVSEGIRDPAAVSPLLPREERTLRCSDVAPHGECTDCGPANNPLCPSRKAVPIEPTEDDPEESPLLCGDVLIMEECADCAAASDVNGLEEVCPSTDPVARPK